MTITIMLVTFNRKDQVGKCLRHNLNHAGMKWDELVWVDNGSTDGMVEVAKSFKPDTLIENPKNLGVSRGYNQAFHACKSDWICIVGDRNNLFHDWLEAFHKVIATGQVDSLCLYDYPGRMAGDRLYGKPEMIGGFRVIPALQNGSMIFRRTLLETAGYWREDMGMYGWNDIEWARRLAHRKIRGYVFSDMFAPHSADDPNSPYFVDGMPYRQWVNAERDHPSKHERLAWCEANNYPYVPYEETPSNPAPKTFQG